MRSVLLSILAFCLTACVGVSQLLVMNGVNEASQIQVDSDVKEAVMGAVTYEEATLGETLVAEGEVALADELGVTDPNNPEAAGAADGAAGNAGAGSNAPAENPMRRKVDFTELKGINSDVSCWIYVPGTHIDYYVMQETEPEIYYYLWRSIYQQRSEWGSIFKPAYDNMDTIKDAHQLIFGHHMAYGEVAFSDLMSYHDKSFAEAHPYIYLYYPDRVERWRVWTGGTIVPWHDVYTVPYELGSSEYDNLLTQLDNDGEWDLRSKPSRTDRTTILSTCDGGGTYRFFLASTWAETYYYDGVSARSSDER